MNQSILNNVDAAESRRRQEIAAVLMRDLFDQLQAMGGLAERMNAAAAGSSRAGDVTADVEQIVEIVGALEQVTKELLADYDAGLSGEQLAALQSRIRHDIINVMEPAYGLCQFLLADEGSELDQATTDLREAFEAFTKQLDFFAGSKVEAAADPSDSSAIGASRGASNGVAAAASDPTMEVEPARVLVADDNRNSAKNLERFLELQRHEVVIVDNGHDALKRLHESDFDLVLLDVIMPGLDGAAVLKQMKSHERLRHIPAIMISGLAEEGRAVDCIAMGAEDYLSKPINYVLLAARIKSSLVRRQAREQELRQFFSKELAKELAHGENLLQSQHADAVSVMFCDIRRFSAISERVGAATTIEWIGSAMSVLSERVFENGGVLVDYIGDELMAMWGAPKPLEDHADRAVKAALAMIDSLDELNAKWARRLGEPMEIGIGVNSGPAHVGVTGSRYKFKYGPLGPAVNLASRAQGVAKYWKASLVATQHTMKNLCDKSAVSSRRLCRAKMVNLAKPVSLYELRRRDAGWNGIFKSYRSALRLFEKRDLGPSARLLGEIMTNHEDDGPSQLLLSRVMAALVGGGDGDFDPVWTAPGK